MKVLAFALAGMACAAVNDLVFKKFADGRRPVGLYMTVIGGVWCGVFLSLASWREGLPAPLPARFWACAAGAGACSALANLLLIEGMARNEAGVSAALYRLNLVPASLMAFAWLGEALTVPKLAGIVLAAGAVLCFWSAASEFRPDPREAGHPLAPCHGRRALLGLGLVSLAALLRAGMGIVTKLGMADYAAQRNLFLAVNGMAWILTGLLVQAFRDGRHSGAEGRIVRRETYAFGAVSGALVCGIVLFMALALSGGDASVVLPIMQLSFVATAVGGILFLDEALTNRKALGFLLAALCVGAMSAAV